MHLPTFLSNFLTFQFSLFISADVDTCTFKSTANDDRPSTPHHHQQQQSCPLFPFYNVFFWFVFTVSGLICSAASFFVLLQHTLLCWACVRICLQHWKKNKKSSHFPIKLFSPNGVHSQRSNRTWKFSADCDRQHTKQNNSTTGCAKHQST